MTDHVRHILEQMGQEKVWDPNGQNPEWCDRRIADHMVHVRIAWRNAHMQTILEDGWDFETARNYVINGDS